MAELIIGLLAGVILGTNWGWGSTESLAAGGVLGTVAYFVSCAVWPYRACPWPWCPKRQQTVGDRRGNYRRRRPCRVCHNADWVRLGARLIGRG